MDLPVYGRYPKKKSILKDNYWVLDCLQYSINNPTFLERTASALYFSFVTFTTLRLGDFEPTTFSAFHLLLISIISIGSLVMEFLLYLVLKFAVLQMKQGLIKTL